MGTDSSEDLNSAPSQLAIALSWVSLLPSKLILSARKHALSTFN